MNPVVDKNPTFEVAALKDGEQQQFLNLFFEGREFHREENVAAMRHLAVSHVTTGLELGQRLLVHKHSLTHGEFEEDLNRVGLEPRSAQRYMFVAKRFGPIRHGQIAGLSLRKMLTIAEELTPDQIQTLANKTKLNDPDLGKSADELRATLRALRQLLDRERLSKVELKRTIQDLKAEREQDEPELSRLQKLTAKAVNALREIKEYVSSGGPKPEMRSEGPEAVQRMETAFAEASLAFDEQGIYAPDSAAARLADK